MSIFISYRRDDSADVSGRIYDRLVNSFGEKAIFKDVDDIPFGVNFRDYLNDMIEESKVLLVVIGPKWLNIQNNHGQRRLDDPADFVRIEIEAAIKRKIIVIPLLVSRASMPNATNLPSTLQELAFYNGTQIRSDPDFHKDMDRLIFELGKQIMPDKMKKISYSRSYSTTSPKKSYGDYTLSDIGSIIITFLDFVTKIIRNFVRLLSTPLGKSLVRSAIGTCLGWLFYIMMDNTFNPSYRFYNQSLYMLLLSWGITGLISYPHKKSIILIILGVMIGITTSFLTPEIWITLYNAKSGSWSTDPGSFRYVDFDAVYDNAYIYWITTGLVLGPPIGAILSRVRLRRKK